MEIVYRSMYGKIVKRCPGLHEYHCHGVLIARGSSISSPDPREAPTGDDWRYCASMRNTETPAEWQTTETRGNERWNTLSTVAD